MELKWKNIEWDDGIVQTDGSFKTSFTQVKEGTGESQRIGRSIVLRRLQFRASVTLPRITNGVVPPPFDVCRIIIFLDSQTRGASPQKGAVISPFNHYRSLYTPDEEYRIHILMDKLITMNYPTLAVIEPPDSTRHWSACAVIKEFSWDFKCAITIDYDDPNGFLTDIISNNIVGYVISRNGECGMSADMRISYTDE